MLSEWAKDVLFPAPMVSYTEHTPGFVNVGRRSRVAAIGVDLDQAETVLLYCHGNGEDAYCSAESMRAILPLTCGLLVPDYHGYGLTEGTRDEQGCVSAVIDAYDWLTDTHCVSPEKIVIVGFSIGTGVALRLASQRASGGCALFAPFFNGRSLIEGWVGKSSADSILGKEFPFPSDKVLKTLEIPIAVAHGRYDEVIPIDSGRNIYKCARNPMGFHVVESGHNDLFLRLGMEGFSGVVKPLIGMPECDGNVRS